MNKVREENIPVINYTGEVKDGDVSDNQDVQRYFCSDKTFVNGIGVTVLTGDYLPPLIIAEVPLGDGIVQKYIVDGLQRTTALMMIRYGNHKFTGNFEDNLIEYQAKKLDENGKVIKDEDGNFVWEKKTFDLKNKTYDDFPNELKKRFDNYQLRIATYQNCTMEKVSKLVRKLNQHKSMNVSQQSITWIPTYARKIKQIADGKFFKNSIAYNDNHRKNGEYLQVVCRSTMNIFHFNDYKKEAKKIANYLEDNSSMSEFNTVQEYFERLEVVCKDLFKNVFVKKDIPVWLAVFHNFTKLALPDSKFGEFMNYLVNEGHSKVVDGNSYDSLNKATGTSDKKVVQDKIDTYTTLMNEYLHNDNMEKETENNVVVESKKDDVLDFINATAHVNVNGDDVMEYMDYIDNIVRVSSPVYHQCYNALLALTAYVYKNDQDQEFADFMADYADNTYYFGDNQVANYNQMKSQFNQYLKRMEANA